MNVSNEYFEWIYSLVCNDRQIRNLSYRKLLHCLNDIEFTYTLLLDGNRAQDGIDFRYRFGYEMGYSRDIIEKYLDTRPCSVLEMMIALAYRCEEQIMDDSSFGNRTGQWFWNMIVSLGLGGMSDAKFNRRHVEDVIFRFLNHEYSHNGAGGLFTVDNPNRDMQHAEIWTQMMWYLDDNFDFSL